MISPVVPGFHEGQPIPSTVLVTTDHVGGRNPIGLDMISVHGEPDAASRRPWDFGSLAFYRESLGVGLRAYFISVFCCASERADNHGAGASDIPGLNQNQIRAMTHGDWREC